MLKQTLDQLTQDIERLQKDNDSLKKDKETLLRDIEERKDAEEFEKLEEESKKDYEVFGLTDKYYDKYLQHFCCVTKSVESTNLSALHVSCFSESWKLKFQF